MPLYEYKCEDGHKFDRYLPVARYDEKQTCECGKSARKILSIPHAMPDIQPYQSMITGEVIGSRSKHRAHLREHNCIEVGNEKMEPKKMQDVPGRKEAIIENYKRLGGRF